MRTAANDLGFKLYVSWSSDFQKLKKKNRYFSTDYLFHLASLNVTKTEKQTLVNVASHQPTKDLETKTLSGFPFGIISDELGKMYIPKNLTYS